MSAKLVAQSLGEGIAKCNMGSDPNDLLLEHALKDGGNDGSGPLRTT